ncbi:O-antigen polymerase [Vibrio alfacsensis]
MADYRKNVNGFSDGSSLLFGEGFSLFFYQFFFKGILISLSISSSIIFFVKGTKKPLYLTTLIIILDCFVSFGRFIIYYHFISFVVAGFFYKKLNIYKMLKISSLLFCFIVCFTLFRFENFSNIYSVLFRNVIGYHVFGFSLFDEFIKTNHLIVPEWSGSAFLANIQYVVQKILNIIGMNMSTLMSSELYRGLSDFVYLGKDVFGDDVYANAFYTNLLDMYLDAGLLSLFIYSCLISVCYAISLTIAKQDDFNIFKVFLLIYLFLFIYFGVFNSQMLLLRNVFSLILLGFIFIFSKRFVLYDR